MENGREVGLNLDAIRLYARDMFVGLRFLQKNGIIHADIKVPPGLCKNCRQREGHTSESTPLDRDTEPAYIV